MRIRSYRDLEIWKRGIALVENIYSVTKLFPREELYGLTSQIRRSSVSIPSNIAEGFARSSGKEYKQFLFITLGSCAELSTQLTISLKLGYLEEVDSKKLLNEIEEISKMTMSLIKKLNFKLETND